jgi:hypothetical protein
MLIAFVARPSGRAALAIRRFAMRLFASRRFGKYRLGVSFDPRELSPRRTTRLATLPAPGPLPVHHHPVVTITLFILWLIGTLTLLGGALLIVAGIFLARL